MTEPKRGIPLLIIAQGSQALTELSASLGGKGFTCLIVSYEEAEEALVRQSPDLILVELSGNLPDSETREFIDGIKRRKSLPTIALLDRGTLDNIGDRLDADDFIASPYDAGELVLRIRRLLHSKRSAGSGELIIRDGLVIDLATCEVTVDSRIVELTFKEYELLKLLASNRGRVYTREALLNRVWGYDYYGGDRTVDVHVRRLRSKIEDANHTFIETVRNIGYRFIKNS